jgi:hypothetical protein
MVKHDHSTANHLPRLVGRSGPAEASNAVFDLMVKCVFDLVVKCVFDLVVKCVFDLVVKCVFDLVVKCEGSIVRQFESLLNFFRTDELSCFFDTIFKNQV